MLDTTLYLAYDIAIIILIRDQTARPNICCELDFVDGFTHEIKKISTQRKFLVSEYFASLCSPDVKMHTKKGLGLHCLVCRWLSLCRGSYRHNTPFSHIP